MKFKFKRDWCGYSRGTDTIVVEADSVEEARDLANAGAGFVDRFVVRDDTQAESWELED